LEVSVNNIRETVGQVAPEYDIKKISLFGSYAKGTQNKDSDIDLLVEFTEPAVSLFKLVALKLKLQEIIGKDVDVIHSPIPPNALIDIEEEVLLYER